MVQCGRPTLINELSASDAGRSVSVIGRCIAFDSMIDRLIIEDEHGTQLLINTTVIEGTIVQSESPIIVMNGLTRVIGELHACADAQSLTHSIKQSIIQSNRQHRQAMKQPNDAAIQSTESPSMPMDISINDHSDDIEVIPESPDQQNEPTPSLDNKEPLNQQISQSMNQPNDQSTHDSTVQPTQQVHATVPLILVARLVLNVDNLDMKLFKAVLIKRREFEQRTGMIIT